MKNVGAVCSVLVCPRILYIFYSDVVHNSLEKRKRLYTHTQTQTRYRMHVFYPIRYPIHQLPNFSSVEPFIFHFIFLSFSLCPQFIEVDRWREEIVFVQNVGVRLTLAGRVPFFFFFSIFIFSFYLKSFVCPGSHFCP